MFEDLEMSLLCYFCATGTNSCTDGLWLIVGWLWRDNVTAKAEHGSQSKSISESPEEVKLRRSRDRPHLNQLPKIQLATSF